MSPPTSATLQFSIQAVSDLEDIVTHSSRQWGKRIADKYIDALGEAIDRIQSQPDLLRPDPNFHPSFRFYRVNKHMLVCDVEPKSIIVLTILSVSMDIPSRLVEMEPFLEKEVQLPHARLRASSSKKRK